MLLWKAYCLSLEGVTGMMRTAGATAIAIGDAAGECERVVCLRESARFVARAALAEVGDRDRDLSCDVVARERPLALGVLNVLVDQVRPPVKVPDFGEYVDNGGDGSSVARRCLQVAIPKTVDACFRSE